MITARTKLLPLLVMLAATGRVAGQLPAAEVATGEDGPPLPTLGGLQLWADVLLFHQWRIQRNALTGRFRLLDGRYLRHAEGTYEHCRWRLEQIKRQRGLPPMRGEAVLLLHGLVRTRWSMSLLAGYIRSHSDYVVFNVGYPSTRAGIEEHAYWLGHLIENLDGIEKIHFVAHSLGNIVVRRYLADRRKNSRAPSGPPVGRLVMLGPPNHGSQIATRLGHLELFRMLLGEAGQQLGRHWVWTEDSLAVPDCQFGIIAGGLGNDEGFNPLLPGDDDGVVSVASTRLAGARDMVVVPVTHSLLIIDPRVHQYALRFLRHGYFVSESQRRPVVGPDNPVPRKPRTEREGSR